MEEATEVQGSTTTGASLLHVILALSPCFLSLLTNNTKV